MSIFGSLSSLTRGKVRRSLSLRRRAVSCRTLQVETLESRLTLGAVPPMVAVEPVEDTAKPVEDVAPAALVADAQIAESADGFSARLKTSLVDALNACAPAKASGTSGVDSNSIRDLLAEAKAVLSGQAAADSLLASRPIELAAVDGGRAGIRTASSILVNVRDAWRSSLADEQPVVRVPILGPIPLKFIGPRLARQALAASWLQTNLLPTVPTVPTQPANDVSYSSESEEADTEVSSSPVITSFDVSMGANSILFIDGEVHYSDPSQLVVIFGGLPEWTGTNPRPDGTFSHEVFVPPGFHGIISAQAFSPMEEVSDITYAWI